MTTQNWQLADVHISAGKGANTSLLTSKDFPGGKVAWVGEHSCEAPFGPTNFDNLELRLTPEQDKLFSGVDAWAIEYFVANSERLLKTNTPAKHPNSNILTNGSLLLDICY